MKNVPYNRSVARAGMQTHSNLSRLDVQKRIVKEKVPSQPFAYNNCPAMLSAPDQMTATDNKAL